MPTNSDNDILPELIIHKNHQCKNGKAKDEKSANGEKKSGTEGLRSGVQSRLLSVRDRFILIPKVNDYRCPPCPCHTGNEGCLLSREASLDGKEKKGQETRQDRIGSEGSVDLFGVF